MAYANFVYLCLLKILLKLNHRMCVQPLTSNRKPWFAVCGKYRIRQSKGLYYQDKLLLFFILKTKNNACRVIYFLSCSKHQIKLKLLFVGKRVVSFPNSQKQFSHLCSKLANSRPCIIPCILHKQILLALGICFNMRKFRYPW